MELRNGVRFNPICSAKMRVFYSSYMTSGAPSEEVVFMTTKMANGGRLLSNNGEGGTKSKTGLNMVTFKGSRYSVSIFSQSGGGGLKVEV